MSDRSSRATRFVTPTVQYDEDLRHWALTNQRILLRVLDLVKEIRRDPFHGTGKPERLRHREGNVWSRRITDEHRLVYHVFDDRIALLRCRGHYDD